MPPFISNKERSKKIESINKHAISKKLVLFVTISLLLAFSILITMSLLLQKKEGNSWWSIMTDTSSITDIKNIHLTTFGWIITSIGFLSIILGVTSLILVMTIKSPKSTFDTTLELINTPMPGRKKYRNSAKETTKRLTSDKNN